MKQYNLNLFYYLQILIEEKHISKAAQKAGITQPAMSHAYKELKSLLSDPILIKTKQGYVATEKAEKIYDALNKAFQILDHSFSNLAFDPATQKKEFILMLTDYAGFVFLPNLLKKIESYPNIRIKVIPWKNLDALENLTFDLAIGFHKNSIPNEFLYETLYHETYICLCSNQHPRIKNTISIEEFLNEEHVIVKEECGAIGVINEKLEKLNLSKQRKIKLQVPHFLLFPFIIANTETIITTTKKNADLFLNKLPLKTVEPPFELPKIPVNLYYSKRFEKSPAHMWLKTILSNLNTKI